MFCKFTSQKTLGSLLVTFSLLALFSTFANAQSSRQLTAMERRIETMNRQAKEYEREEMQRESNGAVKRNAQNLKSAKVIRAEIEEDLNGLQEHYNKVITELQLKKDLSSNFAKEHALLIKKHAARLKVNLSLPKSQQEKTLVAPPSDTRKSLSDLCKQIFDFVTNPMFEGAKGFDVEQSTKAGQSLESIIFMAEQIADA